VVTYEAGPGDIMIKFSELGLEVKVTADRGITVDCRLPWLSSSIIICDQ